MTRMNVPASVPRPVDLALRVAAAMLCGFGCASSSSPPDAVMPNGGSGTTGAGYKGVHMDEKMKGNVAEWQVAQLAPKEAQALLIAAFVGEAVEVVEHAAIKEALMGALSEWLKTRT